MSDFTDLQLDVFDALGYSPGARTPEELAALLDHSTGAVADALDELRLQRWVERVSAWQLASGAEYALRSRLTLTDYQIDIMSDLQNAPGARTVEELAYDSGDDEDLVAETMDWLARNGYVQPVSAFRRPPDPHAAAPRDPYAEDPDATPPDGLPAAAWPEPDDRYTADTDTGLPIPPTWLDPQPGPESPPPVRRRVPIWVNRPG